MFEFEGVELLPEEGVVCSQCLVLLEEDLILPVFGVYLTLKSSYKLQQQTVLHLQLLHYLLSIIPISYQSYAAAVTQSHEWQSY